MERQVREIFDQFKQQLPDIDPVETQEWIDSLDAVVQQGGPDRARFIIYKLLKRARQLQVGLPTLTQTRYINTISPEQEPYFPGDEEMELRVRRMIRWNALAMVLRANTNFEGIGGHLSTYASAASLYEVGFNHFFRGSDDGAGDQIYFQGHAAPGIYARAFLEGRLTEENLDHFRREALTPQGLSSYPHPRLMPEFWQFPTVSMGLGPMNAMLDGDYQKLSVADGAYIREHFFGPDPRLKALVEHLSNDDLAKLRRGGHDYRKVHAAYAAAVEHRGAPVVILAKTVKGWTLGPGIEGRNVTHQAKKLTQDELRIFRDRLELPIPDDQLKEAPYYHPGADAPEIQYMLERRRHLGGLVPKRTVVRSPLPAPEDGAFDEFAAGSDPPASTTIAFSRMG